MGGGGNVAEIGDLATGPGQFGAFAGIGQLAFLTAQEKFEGPLVGGDGHAGESRVFGRDLEAGVQGGQRGKIKVAVAPLELFDGREVMGFEGGNGFLVKGIGAAGDAKGAVAHMASGAAGDLADFGGGQGAELAAVIFGIGGKGDMGDVEIEPHADGVGGDEKFDIAVLEQIDLGVAGARGERAHDDGSPAPFAAQQFGDGVNFRS